MANKLHDLVLSLSGDVAVAEDDLELLEEEEEWSVNKQQKRRKEKGEEIRRLSSPFVACGLQCRSAKPL